MTKSVLERAKRAVEDAKPNAVFVADPRFGRSIWLSDLRALVAVAEAAQHLWNSKHHVTFIANDAYHMYVDDAAYLNLDDALDALADPPRP